MVNQMDLAQVLCCVSYFDDMQGCFTLRVTREGYENQGYSSHDQGFCLEQELGFYPKADEEVFLWTVSLVFGFAASSVEHDGEVR